MKQDYIIREYQDTLYSCLMPHAQEFDYRMPQHSIIHVRSGSLMIEQQGQVVEAKAGSYVFVRRNCSVRITKLSAGPEPYRGINLALRRPVLKSYFAQLPKAQTHGDAQPMSQPAAILPRTVQLESLFQSFTAYVDNNQEPTPELLEMKAREAVMALLSISPSFRPTLFDFNAPWKIDILEFMEENFTEDLSLEQFAHYTGRSLATFKRDFAKLSPLPPQRWLSERRLNKARELLQSGKATAADVCYQVGYHNRSHFSVAFKRQFGIPPSQARA